jgi:hypothetical protein
MPFLKLRIETLTMQEEKELHLEHCSTVVSKTLLVQAVTYFVM